MPSHCAAFACRNRRGKCPDNVTFHRFPKDDNLRLQWAKALNRVKKKGNLWLPGRGNYLCSAHFKPEDFDRTGQTTRLRPNTVPSVCMLPPHLEKKTPPQRTTLNSTIGKQQADDVTSTSSRSDQTLANTRASVALDHAYQLPDAADLKSRLEKANLKRQHLEKELKNTRQRENRVRCSSKVLFDELKEKNLISEEFKAKLESFAGFPAQVQQMVLIKQEAPEEWRPGVDQLDPEPLNIKQEKEEPWTSQEGDQLSVKEESDVSGFSVIAVCLKSEDDEEQPRFSQLHQHQVKDGDPPTSSSAGQMEAAADGEDSGGGQTTRNPDANTQKDDSSSSETELSEDYEDDDEVKSVKSRRKAQTEPESFKCNDCGKSFASKKYLNVHTRVHTGDKPFTCDFCGQRFSFKTNLNSHVKIHTGDKPLECNICEKRFSRKSHLNSHTRVHTGDKPFPCVVCGQRFRHEASLNSHMKVHTRDKPFSCDVCGKRFSQRSSIKTHMRIHTGDKPFPCDFCDQRFSSKASLNSHMRIHTGGKLFPCDFCGQTFSQQSNLNRHMKVHTVKKTA